MHQSKASALTVQMSVALLLSRPDFAQKICEFFHEKENENRYIGNDTDYFGYLLEAIEEASPLLPKEFSDFIKNAFVTSQELFINVIYNFILRVFKEDKYAKK